jgi:hypothetical protein
MTVTNQGDAVVYTSSRTIPAEARTHIAVQVGPELRATEREVFLTASAARASFLRCSGAHLPPDARVTIAARPDALQTKSFANKLR